MAENVSLKTLAWRLIVQTEGVEKNTRNAANSLARFGQMASRVNTLLKASAAALAVREYVKLADAYTNMQNKLRLVTQNQGELNAVQAEVVGIAQRTRSDLESTADLYARSARSLQDYGLSQREVLQFTESVSQAIQVSGATAKEASQGVIQFAQGLASGKLAGDELRAVLEQMPRLGKAIAEGMGVSYEALRRLGAAGKLTTSEILEALKKTAPGIAKEFASMTPTVESSLTTVKNGITALIGEFDRGLGLSAAFARGLTAIGTAMTDMAPKVRNAGLAVREFFDVGLEGVNKWAHDLGPKLRIMRAERILNSKSDVPETPEALERAQIMLAEAQADLSDLDAHWNSVVDEKVAKYEKIRQTLNGLDADLDKKGKDKRGPSEEELKRREAQEAGLNKLEQQLGTGLVNFDVQQNAFNIAMDSGTEAAERYVEASEARLGVDREIYELEKKTGPLDKDRVMGIKNLNEVLVRNAEELAITKEAWAVVTSQINAGKDSFELTAEELDKLTKSIEAVGGDGLLSKKQMDAALARVNVLKSTLTDTAKLGRDAFGAAIGGLTNFMMEGAQDVKGFVSGMIKELGKLVVQFLLIRAVKGTGFAGLFGAQGMVVQGGGLVPFAKGGVVGSPMAFPMSGGRTGIMGEAGPEAVMPLARLPSGDLGVRASPANIEVVNKTGVNAAARIERSGDRTSIILEAAELGAQMAETRMTRSMRNGYGATAATMQRTYALRRQG